MSDIRACLAATLADRYRIERELGQGGMASIRYSSCDSADVTRVTSGERFAIADRRSPIANRSDVRGLA